ncbi:hypothetical protein PaeBR_01035 [Paenibacillus sp. BR2-3]|uniref:hypothetical protein n=1 Tax=Paenibacillus sp. BR2-3 TaxID=3048494 RepID=UPI003977D1FD
MGILRKLLGITSPEKDKIVVIRQEFILAMRKVIPTQRLSEFEVEIKESFRFLMEHISHITAEALINNTQMSVEDVKKITHHSFFEKFIIYYGLNNYFVGWGLGYSTKSGKDNVYMNETISGLKAFADELRREANSCFNSAIFADIFVAAAKQTLIIGEDIGKNYPKISAKNLRLHK